MRAFTVWANCRVPSAFSQGIYRADGNKLYRGLVFRQSSVATTSLLFAFVILYYPFFMVRTQVHLFDLFFPGEQRTLVFLLVAAASSSIQDLILYPRLFTRPRSGGGGGRQLGRQQARRPNFGEFVLGYIEAKSSNPIFIFQHFFSIYKVDTFLHRSGFNY